MIDRAEAVEAFAERLRAAEWVAMDTEADSLHAYPEKLCLVQFSIPEGDYLVDPLSGASLAPLWRALEGKTLILHGADYDLRLLQRQQQFVPAAVFDTMIAARLLGCDRFGLSDLVSRFLGVTLEKGPQKADWARRPLPPRMEAYAFNDTRFLRPLERELTQGLERLGRLEWVRESCAQLVLECSRIREPDPDQIWRIKGSHALSPMGLAVLRELWHWRHRLAMSLNRPPFFVLPHETLIHLAVAAVEGRPLEPLLPRRMHAGWRASILAAVQAGLQLPESEHPRIHRSDSRRITEAEKQRYARLQECRNRVAQRLQLDPSLIAPKAALYLLAESWTRHRGVLMSWQRELLETECAPAGS